MRNVMRQSWWLGILPLAAGAACVGMFALWLRLETPRMETLRVPVAYPIPAPIDTGIPLNPGTLIPGPGTPSDWPGSWPQFRGPRRDNVGESARPLARAWPEGGPREIWRIETGEGHAGAAIHKGRVYLVDYDRERGEDAIRCLSLDDGQEIWRYSYSVDVKRNHGMSRTVPAVNDEYVVALGPKCHVICLKAETGALIWRKDLVAEHGTAIPPWYAGQCPLIDGDRAILAPGGEPLMMAVELATGQTIWETAECAGWGMTHTSVTPVEFEGRRQYVYAAQKGVVSVEAETGAVLWTKPDWTIKIAAIPSPVPLTDNRLFFTGGYNAGSLITRLVGNGGAVNVEELHRRKATEFAGDQQTPIFYQDHLYSVIPSGELACMTPEGDVLWTSGVNRRFGLGPYLIADGLIYVLDDEEGTLHLVEATPETYNELDSAHILFGPDAWGPLALAEGRLILRDLTEMVCLDVGGDT